MFEKVNRSHPDKVADRIAGALVDLAIAQDSNARIAVEVLIGHGICHIIAETSVKLDLEAVTAAVYRIAGKMSVDYQEVPQDLELAKNQATEIRCGDNGIFKGVPMTNEQVHLKNIVYELEEKWPTDGKYIIDEAHSKLVICQSNAEQFKIRKFIEKAYNFKKLIINPLGYWTGGTNVDTGCTNRKLGSDLGDSVTGGGINGKDLSKADVSVNIYCWLKAQKLDKPVEAVCAIGDKEVIVDGRPVKFKTIVDTARQYIEEIGGYEKFSEYGLIR